MGAVDEKVFHRILYEAGKQLEHAYDTSTGLLQTLEKVDTSTGLLQALEKVELCLSMLKQSPPRSMSRSLRKALRPSLNTLVEGHLLRHPDRDVSLLVLNCLTQITKITTPEDPYDDGVMKEILELIVESFQDLGDMNSPSFERRVFLLKIVEEIKLSTVMLNLGLDYLPCEMCELFFAAVSHHAYSTDVRASMKNIMEIVIEESDEISEELLSVFLINLRREMRNTSPAAHSLAIDVVASCAERLRPYLQEKFPPEQAIHCNCVHGYHEIVHEICRHGSQEINASKNTTPADEEAIMTDISTSESTESLVNDPNSQIASCLVSPDGRHNESVNDKKMFDNKKSEANPGLVSLFSHMPPYPFPDVTSGRKRGRGKKRSKVKEDDSVRRARVKTGSKGISSPEETGGESDNNVSVSRSLKRRRTTRNSAKMRRSLKEIETSEDGSTDED